MMKIAMIGHKRIPGREGGVEVVVEELSKRMADGGNSVTAYNRYSKNTLKLNQYQGVRIITIPTINHKKLEAVIYSLIASIHALFGKYDVIHYHALGPSVMLIIPHLFKIRTVVTVHGLNYKTPKWKGFGAKYILMGEKIAAKYADEIIVLSKEQRKYFLEKYNRETTYIPNGITMPTIREANIIKKKWNLEKDSYLLFISRIAPGKGLEYLVEAYKNVASNRKLIIAGDGTSSYTNDFFSKMKELAKDDQRVVFTGFVEGQVLEELYSNAYAFVFPSEAEGMSMCLLEAMSYNCICLVSNIPENLEIIGSFGTYFESAKVGDLQNKIKCILEQRPDVDCQEYIINNYNWDSIVGKTLSLYEKRNLKDA